MSKYIDIGIKKDLFSNASKANQDNRDGLEDTELIIKNVVVTFNIEIKENLSSDASKANQDNTDSLEGNNQTY